MGRSRGQTKHPQEGNPELTRASTPSSRMKHSGSTGCRQEVEGADDLGLAPWRCQRDSASAGARVSLVIKPVHGKVVLSMIIMLRSPVPDVLRWEVSFAWVVNSGEIHKDFVLLLEVSHQTREMLSLSFERVGRQYSQTTLIPAAGKEIKRLVSSTQSYPIAMAPY